MDSILVTGGAGFIGSNFVRRVLSQGNTRVVNLDNLTYAGNLHTLADVNDASRHFFVHGDIADQALVRRLLEEHRCQAIVHFAAETHVDRSIGDPGSFVRANVNGTFQLLEAALAYWEAGSNELRDQFRFLHVSTDEVYGSLGPTGKFSETTPYAPNSPYSASKAASDHFVRAYFKTYGLPAVTTNCSNNYGPYQFPEKLIPLTILNALEGRPLPVYGAGANVRDWLYVGDHCRALEMVLQRGRLGEVYNIGGNCEYTNLDVVKLICDTVDRLLLDMPQQPTSNSIQFVADRPGHDQRYAVDTGKIEHELGWRPQISFADGIEQTVRWYIENRAFVEAVTAGKYQRERLGLRKPTVVSPPAAPAAPPEPPAPTEQPIEGVLFTSLKRYRDSRGWLVELYRDDELPREHWPVMAYMSETLPGVARGPHEHVDQADYFAFIGPGDFRLFLWDARVDSPTYGNRIVRIVGQNNPQSVIIPPGVVHAYKNISRQPGCVFNAPNRLFAGEGKQETIDEIRHDNRKDSPYAVA